MNNIPENMRAFDINLAQQSHPLCTRGGRPAKFIAYVPDVIEHHQVVLQIQDEIYQYPTTGKSTVAMYNWDIFLSPLGTCEGKPVFAGDVLITTVGGYIQDVGKEFTVETHHNEFSMLKWPSKLPVVETQMDYDDLCEYYKDIAEKEYVAISSEPEHFTWSSKACKNLANKAIERAIADGDVILTGIVAKLAGDAYNKRMAGGFSYVEYFNDVLKEYLEGLK